MNLEKWLNRYKTDCAMKYNSDSTKENYTSGVKSFLMKFDKYSEPKEISTQEIKEYLLTLIKSCQSYYLLMKFNLCLKFARI